MLKIFIYNSDNNNGDVYKNVLYMFMCIMVFHEKIQII